MLKHRYENFVINQVGKETKFGQVTIPRGYVNATQMCQKHGKEWSNYARLKGTKDFIHELSADLHIVPSALVVKVLGGGQGNGGREQATWVHFEIAIDLADKF